MKNLNFKKNLGRWVAIGLLFWGSVCNVYSQSVKVEGETFTSSCCGDGVVKLENTGSSVGYFDNDGEKLTYSISVATAGYYTMSFKYNAGDKGQILVKTSQNAEGLIDFDAVTNPGGKWWELPIGSWPTVSNSTLFYFPAGTQTLYLINKGVGFNIDYFTLAFSSNQSVTVNKIEVTPNPLSVKPQNTATLVAKAFSGSTVVAVPFTWSTNAQNGVYTAGNVGTDNITVSYQTISVTVPVIIELTKKKQKFVVTHHGDLKIDPNYGGGFVDKNGNKASFAGPSWFWSCSSPKYWTKEAVNYFVRDWNAGIIRLPMSIGPGMYGEWGDATGDSWNKDNYYHRPDYALNMMKTMIDAAIENDVYVVVDFHEHHAEKFIPQAKTFFEEIAKAYGAYDNVIFEIFNEPIHHSWSDLKYYANQVIPVIRKYSDNIIVVGTPFYSQNIQDVDNDLSHYGNIAYTLHYYATAHGSSLLGKMDYGKPVMITECGNDGGAMWDYISKAKTKGISMMSWAVNNKGGDDSPWSVFTENNSNYTGNWTDADLSNAGKTQKGIIKDWPRAVTIEPICADNVLRSIEIVAPKTTVLVNEEISLTVKGKSTCQDVAITSPVTWTGANAGKFSSATKGTYTVGACVNGICSEITLTVTEDIVVDNMLTNGDFSNGITGWTAYVHTSAGATVAAQNGGCNSVITNGGTATWNVQFFQGNLKIENGKTYKVTFDAKAESNRSIEAVVEKNGSPYTLFGGGAKNITTTLTNYSYEFTMTQATELNGRVTFNIGNSASDVFIDNVVLTVVGGTTNQKPVANAGANQSLPAGTTTATLSGTASSDPDNGPSPLTYSWTQTAGATVTISSATVASPVISGLANGNSYTFQLVVNDGKDNSTPASVTVTVQSNANSVLIQAESYVMTGGAGSGVKKEATQDVGGGDNIGWIDNGDWATYSGLNIPAGTYSVEIRYAGFGGQIQFEKAGGSPKYGSVISLDSENGWQNWDSKTVTINVTENTTDLGVAFPVGGININWYKFTPVAALKSSQIETSIDETAVTNRVDFYPNPVANTLRVENKFEGQSTFVLYDMSGKTLVLKNINSGISQFDVSKLSPGVYFAKILNGTTVINKKIVKR